MKGAVKYAIAIVDIDDSGKSSVRYIPITCAGVGGRNISNINSSFIRLFDTKEEAQKYADGMDLSVIVPIRILTKYDIFQFNDKGVAETVGLDLDCDYGWVPYGSQLTMHFSKEEDAEKIRGWFAKRGDCNVHIQAVTIRRVEQGVLML